MIEVIATIQVDRRVGEYADFLTTQRASELGNRTEAPKLLAIVDRLLLNWRSTSYLAAMPAMYVTSQKATLEGYAKGEVSDTMLLALTEHLLLSFAQLVPEMVNEPGLVRKLNQALIIRGANFRDARDKAKMVFEVDDKWEEFLAFPPFAQYVWSSERLSYQAVYNAYEDFLIDCANVTANKPNLRTADKEFKRALEALGVYADCWEARPVLEIRLLRHSLAHVSGRITENMDKHNVKPMNDDEVSQVFPENVKKAIDVLTSCVLKVIDAASPLPAYN